MFVKYVPVGLTTGEGLKLEVHVGWLSVRIGKFQPGRLTSTLTLGTATLITIHTVYMVTRTEQDATSIIFGFFVFIRVSNI